MSPRKLSTTGYPENARLRLGNEVAKARMAAGYKRRTDFGHDHNINTRSLELLENGRPGVGQSILYAIGRALPGWTEDTPRAILEGADAPANDRRQDNRAEAKPAAYLRSVAVFELAEMIAAGEDAGTYNRELGRWRVRLGESADIFAIAEEAQALAESESDLRRMQAQVRGAFGEQAEGDIASGQS